jgi:hypothetical protein
MNLSPPFPTLKMPAIYSSETVSKLYGVKTQRMIFLLLSSSERQIQYDIYFKMITSLINHEFPIYLWLHSPLCWYTQSVGLLGREISLSQGLYVYSEQHKHRINAHNIHASNGIRTYDPSVWAGEDSSCLRPRGHCDHHEFPVRKSIYFIVWKIDFFIYCFVSVKSISP